MKVVVNLLSLKRHSFFIIAMVCTLSFGQTPDTIRHTGGNRTQRQVEKSAEAVRPAKCRAFDRVLSKGKFLYVICDRSRIDIYSISDPSQPEFLSTFQKGKGYSEIVIKGDFAYLSTVNTIEIVDLRDPRDPKLVTSITGKLHGCHLFVSGDVLYSVAGRLGLVTAWDIKDPAHPKELFRVRVPTTPTSVGSFDATVEGNLLYYVIRDDDALDQFYIVDLARLELLSKLKIPSSDNVSAVWTQFPYAYATGRGNSGDVIDISNPSSPQVVGELKGIAKAFFGDYSLNNWDGGLYLNDLSDPKNPTLIKEIEVPYEKKQATDISVGDENDFAYAVYGNELGIIDIRDPKNPKFIKSR